MIKSSIYEQQNIPSIQHTLYTLGLGILKLFAPIYPHITEELYTTIYKPHEAHKSIHLAPWPEPPLNDTNSLAEGEIVKDYISLTRAYKSQQGIALNAPLNISETYAPKNKATILNKHKKLINSTLNLPEKHIFKPGKPSIQETITHITPIYAKLGPRFKKDSKAIITWLESHQDSLKKLLKKQNDITWKDIPPAHLNDPESLIQNNYIKIEKTLSLEHNTNITVIKLENYYLDVKGESTHEIS